MNNTIPWLKDLLVALQETARIVGNILTFIGWFLFCVGICDLDDVSPEDTVFQTCGYWIVPGWLLLRLAAGLFPFGRRFVKS